MMMRGGGSSLTTQPTRSRSSTSATILEATLALGAGELAQALDEDNPDFINRFRKLHYRYRNLPQGGHKDVQNWPATKHIHYLAHQRMYLLAQVIGRMQFPRIQDRLDQARRDVLREISEQRDLHVGCIDAIGAVISPRKSTLIRWADMQITPEFSEDPTITGYRISGKVLKALKEAHHMQVRSILNLIASMPNTVGT